MEAEKQSMEQAKYPLKVLIIDDEPDLRQIICEVFTTFGWYVQDVENGQEGLEEMLKNKYDFVLSDIRMPIATGIDMLKKLPNQIKKDTSIIMMSAYSDHSEKSVQTLGALKLIPKPVSMSALVQEMSTFKNNLKSSPQAA
jgi:two-component system response regulator PilR (NtrC family)